jgi:hypothetical protein
MMTYNFDVSDIIGKYKCTNIRPRNRRSEKYMQCKLHVSFVDRGPFYVYYEAVRRLGIPYCYCHMFIPF